MFHTIRAFLPDHVPLAREVCVSEPATGQTNVRNYLWRASWRPRPVHHSAAKAFLDCNDVQGRKVRTVRSVPSSLNKIFFLRPRVGVCGMLLRQFGSRSMGRQSAEFFASGLRWISQKIQVTFVLRRHFPLAASIATMTSACAKPNSTAVAY
jgi:hypothetical protein